MNGDHRHIEEQNGRRQVRFAFLATIGSMFIGGLIGAVITLTFINPSSPDLDLPRWTIVLSESLILLPLIFVIQRRRLSLKATFRLQGVSLVTLRNTLLIGLGVSVLIDELDRLLALVFPLPDYITRGMEFLTFSTGSEVLLVAAGVVVIAPLVEEIVFRGFFQGQLEKGYRDVTKAVLLSSLLFTVLHFNPWWSLQIYFLGMVLGYLAWRTGSIWPSFVVHALNNSLSLWFANAAEGSLSWYAPGGHVSPLWLGAAAMITYIGFRSLLVQTSEPLLSDYSGRDIT
ncbi:MAG: CPBP family intramembrane metalloprotease [Fidelibacterota bacterium]|nr:MAG: CPBP family intramembrane metalloprotease [Candidatus Neomarinimicrobiota bacterium]